MTAATLSVTPQWMRLLLLMFGVLGSDLGNDQSPADPTPTNLTYRLHVADEEASASYDCSSRRQRHYAKDFQKRFGSRINRLSAYHVARQGHPDPSFVVISSCRRSLQTRSFDDALHKRAMEAFEPKLRALEEEFGPEAH